MVKTKTIRKLYIDKARYLIDNGSGESVSVVIDYSKGKFKVAGKPEDELLEDIEIFAKDLIERKSNVNFA